MPMEDFCHNLSSFILWPVLELIDLVMYYAFRDFWWLKCYPLQHVSVMEILDV